jgi:hypothetical protein
MSVGLGVISVGGSRQWIGKAFGSASISLVKPSPPPRPAEIVRHAIRASGGLGEPWDLDGGNAVRVGNLLIEIDVDELGWVMMAYLIGGGEADLVAVLAAEHGDPVRALTAWLRAVAAPMSWKRVRPGVYRCGGYLVGQLDTGEWFAEGPGVDRCFDHKHDAQAACAAARNDTVPPDGVVVGAGLRWRWTIRAIHRRFPPLVRKPERGGPAWTGSGW